MFKTACENMLGIELSGGKETHEANKLEKCVNNCLLEFVQKILELTNKLSNDNSLITRKLDKVISSNARLEEFIFKSQKCFEKRSEVAYESSVEYVDGFTGTPTTKIRVENNDTNSNNPTVNNKQICCASKPKQTDVNSSSVHTESDFSKLLSISESPNVAEEWGSNCLQEWEVPTHHNNMQDPLDTIEEEYSPSEDFLVHSRFTIEKREYEDGEEKEECEIDMEECSPSEDFRVHSGLSIEKTEYDAVEEKAESETGKEDLKHEVESTSVGNEPESNNIVGMEDNRNKDDNSSLFTKVSQPAGKVHKNQCTTKQEVCCRNQSCKSCVVHRCDLSEKIFRNLQELEHTSMTRCQLQHSCKKCFKIFTSSSNLEKHFRMHTSVTKNVSDVSHEAFTHESNLKQNSRLDHGEHPYSCSVCNKKFTLKGNLNRHLRLHSGERRFSCSICSKTFAKKQNMQVHLRVHSGERPYSCSICNKTFIVRSHLKLHLMSHTGERPYSCSICNKTFSNKSTLQQHIMVHTGERPYSCGICSKGFKQKIHMQKHLVVHSRERPYSCNICNKTYTQKITLQRHSKVHSGEHPYSCSICSKTFRQKIHVQKHLKVHSGERPYS